MLGPQGNEAPRSRKPGESLTRHVHHPLGYPGKDGHHLVPHRGIEVQVPTLVLGFEARLYAWNGASCTKRTGRAGKKGRTLRYEERLEGSKGNIR